jgi:hypothetical protein
MLLLQSHDIPQSAMPDLLAHHSECCGKGWISSQTVSTLLPAMVQQSVPAASRSMPRHNAESKFSQVAAASSVLPAKFGLNRLHHEESATLFLWLQPPLQ